MRNNIREFLNLKGKIKLFNSQGDVIYEENERGYWSKYERDSAGRLTRYEESDGFWYECKYNHKGNEIYYRDSIGVSHDNRKTCDGKEVEIDGKTYTLKLNK